MAYRPRERSSMSFEQLTIDQVLRSTLDPCERKSRGNENSKAAHAKIVHSKAETHAKILDYVKLRNGATVHEISNALGYGDAINRVSGRLSELKLMKPPKLRESGLKRNGAAVLILS